MIHRRGEEIEEFKKEIIINLVKFIIISYLFSQMCNFDKIVLIRRFIFFIFIKLTLTGLIHHLNVYIIKLSFGGDWCFILKTKRLFFIYAQFP